LTSPRRPCILCAFLLDNHKFAEREGSRMADDGSILVTGAAGQLGAVGRTMTELLLDRGLPVHAMVRREDDRATALRAARAGIVAARSAFRRTRSATNRFACSSSAATERCRPNPASPSCCGRYAVSALRRSPARWSPPTPMSRSGSSGRGISCASWTAIGAGDPQAVEPLLRKYYPAGWLRKRLVSLVTSAIGYS